MTRTTSSHLRPRFALALCLGLGLLAPLAAPATAQETINRVVLRINDEILTLHEYEKRKEAEVNTVLADPQISPADRQERLAGIGPEVMQQVFREMLLESFARRNGVTVSEREVDDAVRQVQERQGFTNSQELLRALEQAGLTLEELRHNLRQELLLSTVVRREVTGKIEIGDDEQRAYYRSHPEEFEVEEERRLEEVIVLEDSGLPREELLATAQKILAELVAGAELEEVAARYQDQGVSTGVVDLGWVKREDLESNLADAAFAVPEGGYTEPVEARGGFHVVHAAEVKEGYVRPFEEVQDWIVARERQRRFGSELRRFMAEIEESSYIHEDLPQEAVGYRNLAEDYEPEDELREFRAPIDELSASDEDSEEDEAGEDETGEADADAGSGS